MQAVCNELVVSLTPDFGKGVSSVLRNYTLVGPQALLCVDNAYPARVPSLLSCSENSWGDKLVAVECELTLRRQNSCFLLLSDKPWRDGRNTQDTDRRIGENS